MNVNFPNRLDAIIAQTSLIPAALIAWFVVCILALNSAVLRD
jgi:hypothetical protein